MSGRPLFIVDGRQCSRCADWDRPERAFEEPRGAADTGVCARFLVPVAGMNLRPLDRRLARWRRLLCEGRSRRLQQTIERTRAAEG